MKTIRGGMNLSFDRDQVREELLRTRTSSEMRGFRDNYGYIVHYNQGIPDKLGEGTLLTAITAIAIATGNYSMPESWERENANKYLKELLSTLLHQSWGNKDSFGRQHPIRHPDWHDYDTSGIQLRNRPMSKDSFGAIVVAAYYSFTSRYSDEEVRSIAYELIRKWSEYLIQFQWKTHSMFIREELEKDNEGKYLHLRGYNPFEKKFEKTSFLGPDSFMLWSHEIYALQNVAAKMGIPTSHWDVRKNINKELIQIIIDYAVPLIVDVACRVLDSILKKWAYPFEYSIQLGPDNWSFGRIVGFHVLKIPSKTREEIIEGFRNALQEIIREYVRLNTTDQLPDVIGAAINRILDKLPMEISPESWRSKLTETIQQVHPWFTGNSWYELVIFLASLQLLKTQKPAEINYTVWPYIAECETRPEIGYLLSSAISEFSGFLEKDENPNGLCAWLAFDSNIVYEQLNLIKSHDPDYWWEFAFDSAKFNDWVSKPKKEPSAKEGKQSPRLDFLILEGLSRRGHRAEFPPDLSIKLNFSPSELEDAKNIFIDGIKKTFNETGKYVKEEFSDFIGFPQRFYKKVWDATFTYTEEILTEGKLVTKITSVANGLYTKELWNQDNLKYLKRLWTDSSAAGKLIERVEIGLNDVLTHEYWNSDTAKYWKGIWSDATEDAEKMIECIIIDLNGVLSHEYWNRGPDKYWKGVWADASGKAEKILERVIINSEDIKEVVVWDVNGISSRTVYNKFGELISDSIIPWVPPIDIPPFNW